MKEFEPSRTTNALPAVKMSSKRVVGALTKAFDGKVNKFGVQRAAAWISVADKVSVAAEKDPHNAGLKRMLDTYALMIENWTEREVRFRIEKNTFGSRRCISFCGR